MAGWRGHGLRIAACAVAGVLAGLLAGLALPAKIATAIGWDVAAIAYSARVLATLLPVPAEEISGWSAQEDEGRWAITLILAAAVAASVFAIFDMVSSKSSGAVLALAAVTILSSWTLLHTAFAAHYAHRCFSRGPRQPGLDFPGEKPRFADFLYYSYTIGMTFQTSDVDTRTSEMRTLTLVHGIFSFVFNTVIIAISVGLASGLLGD
ncbi:MAG: DUF1345 domain-containing protein [Ancylobacter novellus]|uniref:DUF1345 domain-containing protein n=1 Tax=Ancylobacter novellus TaxID=921 RepID=A0A2W5KMK7_ANCNO|nr:MAG: DUF1345 domain-containing protein [Ancylobacter novellus]